MSQQSAMEYAASKPLFNRGRVGWALYDWANQGFTTIIITFVFSTYFAKGIVGQEAVGQATWAVGIGWSAFFIAILAPILGSVADMRGGRKPWVIGFAIACMIATLGLFFMMPDPSYILPALCLVVFANICYELSIVFNNAMLADLVDRKRLAKLSGIAWSGGYFGGLITLFICLIPIMIVPLESDNSLDVRLSPLVVSAWFAIFIIPFALWTPDRAPTGVGFGEAITKGLAKLWQTLVKVFTQDRNLFWFLMGRMSYIDGVNTIFAMGAVFAAGKYGLETEDVIIFGILINVFSGAGGMAFAMVEQRIGTRTVIMTAIVGLIISGSAMMLAPDYTMFVILGCVLGMFVGPIQQASRTGMAKLAPLDAQTELFGLYAMTGKATSMLGPWAVAGLTAWAIGSGFEGATAQTIGMFGVMPFLVLGGIIMLFVKIPRD